MNKIEAVIAIVRDARLDKGSLANYKRMVRALRALEFNDEDAAVILVHLDYLNPGTREPYEWLAKKLAEKR